MDHIFKHDGIKDWLWYEYNPNHRKLRGKVLRLLSGELNNHFNCLPLGHETLIRGEELKATLATVLDRFYAKDPYKRPTRLRDGDEKYLISAIKNKLIIPIQVKDYVHDRRIKK